MKASFAAGLLLLATLAALAQDPFSQGDPYESRFKARPNFQIRFKTPEKGGEVRLYTKKPVSFEKDQSGLGRSQAVKMPWSIRYVASPIFSIDRATMW